MKALAASSIDMPATLVKLVISPTHNHAIEWASAAGFHTEIVPKTPDYANQLLATLLKHQINIICLAGYMYLLPEEIVQAYSRRILNIHPSLLPKFGGQGMHGMHVHEAVVAAGSLRSGCTVHFVNERYDEGDIFLQMSCPIKSDDTPEDVADKVLKLEHVTYPLALKMLLSELKKEFQSSI